MTKRTTLNNRIIVDPNILVGKPIIKGTRISVELVLKHLALNPNLNELLAAYPHLTVDDVRACLSYAQSLVQGEDIYPAIRIPTRDHAPQLTA